MFHPYTLVIHPDFKELGDFILSLPERFEKNEGIVIHKGRNELRKMEYGGREYVVKSFPRPNIINRFVYGIFRPSKAKRSYDQTAPPLCWPIPSPNSNPSWTPAKMP